MARSITRYLQGDHQRLHALLERATPGIDGSVDLEAFGHFRKGLLRHIGIEEKLLIPAARRALGHEVPDFARLRTDHARLVALLVPTPTGVIVEEIRSILDAHSALEESPEGLFSVCERILALESDDLVARMESAPEVPVRPYNDARRPIILNRH